MENIVVSWEFTEKNKGWFHRRQNLLQGAGQGWRLKLSGSCSIILYILLYRYIYSPIYTILDSHMLGQSYMDTLILTSLLVWKWEYVRSPAKNFLAGYLKFAMIRLVRFVDVCSAASMHSDIPSGKHTSNNGKSHLLSCVNQQVRLGHFQ